MGNRLPETLTEGLVKFKGKEFSVPPDLAAWMSTIFGDKRGLLTPAGGALSQPVDLTNARSMEPLDLHGDFLYLDIESTGKIYVKLNNPQMPWIPLKAGQGFKTPYSRLFIKNGAQSGCVANLLFGYGSEFLASQQMYQWYDRNPVSQGKSYSATGVAPHADTQRWTYTVPNGKKVMLETSLAQVVRITAAAPVGLAKAAVNLTPLSVTSVFTTGVFHNKNGVGDSENAFMGCGAQLQAGEIIEARTQDGSTGGTMLYNIQVKLTEFDA